MVFALGVLKLVFDCPMGGCLLTAKAALSFSGGRMDCCETIRHMAGWTVAFFWWAGPPWPVAATL